MLSKNQVVLVRKAIESMYESTCTVIEHRPYEKANNSTGFKDIIVLENEPCHLEYKTISAAKQGDTVATVSQEIKIYISPDVEIIPGSKIIVNLVNYTLAGVAAKYATHQEISLKLWERWV